MEYAPTAETIDERLPARHDARRSSTSRGRADERPGASRCASCPIRRPRCAPASSASRSQARRGRRATCRSGTSCGMTAAARRPTDADSVDRKPRVPRPLRLRPQAAARRRPAGRENRPRPEVRRHRAARHGITLAGSASTRCSRAICSTRRDPAIRSKARARAPRLQGADRRGRVRTRREGLPSPTSRRRRLLDLRRRARRPGAAARRPASRRCWRASGSTRVYADLERPLIPVLAPSSGRASGSTARRWPRSRSTSNASWRRAVPNFELAARPSTSTRRKQLSEILFDKLQLPTLKRNVKTATRVHRRRGARGAGARARPAAADSRMARAAEAEGDLHRRAAAARESGDRPGAYVLQPGGGRDRPAEQQRPEPAEHPDPHRARPRDPRAPSSPSRAIS